MGWVNAYETINKGKLGYAQSWKYQKKRKYHYYEQFKIFSLVKPLDLKSYDF